MKKKGQHTWQGWKFDQVRLDRVIEYWKNKGIREDVLRDVVECLQEYKETNEQEYKETNE